MNSAEESLEHRPVRGFEDLECWKACRDLRLFVTRRVVPELPDRERFRLCDQLIRSARSTTANIAEGYGRYHFVDNAKFCSQARGSAWELLDHLITGNDEGFISRELLEEGRSRVTTAIRLINGYMAYLRKAAKS